MLATNADFTLIGKNVIMTNMKDFLPKSIFKKVVLSTNISANILFSIFYSTFPVNAMLAEESIAPALKPISHSVSKSQSGAPLSKLPHNCNMPDLLSAASECYCTPMRALTLTSQTNGATQSAGSTDRGRQEDEPSQQRQANLDESWQSDGLEGKLVVIDMSDILPAAETTLFTIHEEQTSTSPAQPSVLIPNEFLADLEAAHEGDISQQDLFELASSIAQEDSRSTSAFEANIEASMLEDMQRNVDALGVVEQVVHAADITHIQDTSQSSLQLINYSLKLACCARRMCAKNVQSSLVRVYYGFAKDAPLEIRDALPIKDYIAETQTTKTHLPLCKPQAIKRVQSMHEVKISQAVLDMASCNLQDRYPPASCDNSGVILDDSCVLETSLLGDMRYAEHNQAKANTNYLESCVLRINASMHESILQYYIYIGNALDYFDLAHYAYAKLLIMRAYKAREPNIDAIIDEFNAAGCNGEEVFKDTDDSTMKMLTQSVENAYYHHAHKNGYLIFDAQQFDSMPRHIPYGIIKGAYDAIELSWGTFLKEQVDANNAVAKKVAEQTMEVADYAYLKDMIQKMPKATLENIGLQTMLMNGLTQHAFLTILNNLHIRAFDAHSFINQLLNDKQQEYKHDLLHLNASEFRVDHPTYFDDLNHLILIRLDFEGFWRATDKPEFYLEAHEEESYFDAIRHLF